MKSILLSAAMERISNQAIKRIYLIYWKGDKLYVGSK